METVKRNWGHYHVLYEGDDYKVKLLQIDPHSSLSNQYHNHRDEHWKVVKGEVVIELYNPDTDKEPYTITLQTGASWTITKGTWHKASNKKDHITEVVEVWSGNHLSEEDIVRQ